MDDAQIQLIYRAVVIATLAYASSSWWGFTSASDRQRLEGFLRRGRRYGLYPADQPTRRARHSGSYSDDQPTFALLAEDADDILFRKVTPPTISSTPFYLNKPLTHII